ncbi:MAG TPA: glutamate--cysteine ligase [Acidimicrobiales bacterium]
MTGIAGGAGGAGVTGSEGAPGEVLVGVEEEFLLLDADTARPAPRITEILPDAARTAGENAQPELHRAQIEIATEPCRTLGALRAELTRLRVQVVEAARRSNTLVVAAGTYPGQMGPPGRLVTPEPRYEQIARDASVLGAEQLICGCHVHVSVAPERAVPAMNRVRRWLPVVLALSANSPFWEGQDTGFSSFRTEVWVRWPTAGPIGGFASMAEYEALLDRLVATGVILDRAMAYWDVRPSQRFPTLEVRVADVMPSTDEVVAVAGVIRALVVWAAEGRGGPEADRPLRPELQRAASWRAARAGLGEELIDPLLGTAAPASAAVAQLVELLGPTMEELGDRLELVGLVARLLERGNGADRQRRAFRRRHALGDVVGALTLDAGGEPPGTA